MTTATTIHAARRRPAAPDGPTDLDVLGRELLAEARTLAARRSARTLTPGRGPELTQTLLALAAGERLHDHVAPGTTTLLCLTGTVVLDRAGERVVLSGGTWSPCPSGPHALEAVSDALVLLTVAPGRAGAAA